MIKLKEYVKSNCYKFAFNISTPYEYYENDKYCNMFIAVFGHSWWFRIPAIISPVKEWVNMYVQYGRPNYKPGDGYWNYIQRNYGFTFTDVGLHLNYGTTESSGISKNKHDHTKFWFYPWNYGRESIRFMNDACEETHIYNDNINSSINFKQLHAIEESAQRFYFQFNDYDGQLITATCTIQQSVYKRGHDSKWFRWLGKIFPDKIYKKLDINFNKEIGYEKGTYRGGTLGHSIEMLPNEKALMAFIRYGTADDRYKNHGIKNRGFTNIKQL